MVNFYKENDGTLHIEAVDLEKGRIYEKSTTDYEDMEDLSELKEMSQRLKIEAHKLKLVHRPKRENLKLCRLKTINGRKYVIIIQKFQRTLNVEAQEDGNKDH